MNDLVWELNYRGDAPLLNYSTNGLKNTLQINGDVFFPDEVDLYNVKEKDPDGFDSYLFGMDEALKFLNIFLYEDLELEYDDDAIDENELEVPDVYLSYTGKIKQVSKHLKVRLLKGKE